MIKKLDESKLLDKLKVLAQKEELVLPSLKSIENFDHSIDENANQLEFTNQAKDIVDIYQTLQKEFNEKYHELIDIYKQSDKVLKLKSDKKWKELNLVKADKALEEKFEVLKEKVETINYWYENITWLQEKFPEAKYQDITGLCKVASRDEYVEEHDYSLNAGRYVGVALEDDNLSQEEFKELIGEKHQEFQKLNSEASCLEKLIDRNMKNILDDINVK